MVRLPDLLTPIAGETQMHHFDAAPNRLAGRLLHKASERGFFTSRVAEVVGSGAFCS
jgi:hypothetical protein